MRRSAAVTLLALAGCAPKGPPDIRVETDHLDYGWVTPFEARHATMRVWNGGGERLDVLLTVVSGAEFFTAFEQGDVDDGELEISPGGEAQVEVRFAAEVRGTFEGELRLASNDPDEAVVNIALDAVMDQDDDGDGWYSVDDCDDGEARVNPEAEDPPDDGVDWDCDGTD